MASETRQLPTAARTVGVAGALLLRAVGSTWRVREVDREHERRILAGGGSPLYAFWHGQLLPLAYVMRGRDIVVLVSEHRDGEYITQVIHRLGYDTVRGSTTRGGFRSLVELARLGLSGRAIAITPDGPRGPRRQAQIGVLLAAQRGRTPIVPLAMSVSRARQLDSWDRFVIPKPFARGVVAFGAPIEVPPELKPDELSAQWLPRVAAAIDATTERTARCLREWVGKSEGDAFEPIN